MMPIISKKELHDLRTRVEVAENYLLEGPVESQRDYLDSLDTYGAFSEKLRDNVQKFEPISEKEQDEHLQRALEVFMNSKLLDFYELNETIELLMKKSGWSDEWTGRLGFAYYLGLTEKNLGVRGVDEKRDEHFDEAMKAFNRPSIGELDAVVKATSKFRIEKPAWGDSWQGTACFAYFYGKTLQKKDKEMS